MEEIIARTKRGLYIGTYIVCIFLSLFLVAFGAVCAVVAGKEVAEAAAVGWIFLALGLILLIANICWLVYFIKMPQVAISFKDGKLNFMNKVICAPTEVESWQTNEHGLDGALFNFGKLTVVINGTQYKFKFVDNAKGVPARLYSLKMEYAMKAEIAKKAEEESKPKVEQSSEEVKEELGETEVKTEE